MADGRQAVALILAEHTIVRMRMDAREARDYLHTRLARNVRFERCPHLAQIYPFTAQQCAHLASLTLHECHALTSLPETMFEGMQNLTTLTISGCNSLTLLPKSMDSLQALTRLIIIDVPSLTALPDSLWTLPNLHTISLLNCGITRLSEEMCNAAGLNHLMLSRMDALQALPEGFGQLSGLEMLSIIRCPLLTRLPASFAALQSLDALNISNCPLAEFPVQLCHVQTLQRLTLAFLPANAVHVGISGLQHLESCNIVGWPALSQLPDSIGALRSLNHLNLSQCTALTRLPDSVGDLSMLESLELEGCGALTELPESIGRLRRLDLLAINGCTALATLPESIRNLSQNVTIGMATCTGLRALPLALGHLTMSARHDLARMAGSDVMAFPPADIRRQAHPAVHLFLRRLLNDQRRAAMLAAIVASRAQRLGRRRMPHIPNEVWGLVIDQLIILLGDLLRD